MCIQSATQIVLAHFTDWSGSFHQGRLQSDQVSLPNQRELDQQVHWGSQQDCFLVWLLGRGLLLLLAPDRLSPRRLSQFHFWPSIEHCQSSHCYIWFVQHYYHPNSNPLHLPWPAPADHGAPRLHFCKRRFPRWHSFGPARLGLPGMERALHEKGGHRANVAQ